MPPAQDLTTLPDHVVVDAYVRYDANGDFNEGLTLVRSLSGALLRRVTFSLTATVLHDPLTCRRDDRPASEMPSIGQTLTNLTREADARRGEIEAGELKLHPIAQAGQAVMIRTNFGTASVEFEELLGAKIDTIEARETVWLVDLSSIAAEAIGITPSGRRIQILLQRTLISEALPSDDWPNILDRYNTP